MKVDTMRSIDYFAGVPLCFLVTQIKRLLPRKNTQSAPQKVALIELSEMGSAILVDPAMRKMQQQGAELYFVIFKKNAGSLKLLNTVAQENIYTIREDGLLPLLVDTIKFFFWMRKNNIDTVIDLELFSRFTALLSGLSGASRKVGYYGFHNEGLYRGELLTHRVAYNAHMHISKNFIALVNAAYSEKNEIPFSKTVISDNDVVLAKAKISLENKNHIHSIIKNCYSGYDQNNNRIVLINPNASELLIQRRWMPENYIAVMKQILKTHDDIIILITGAPNEKDEAQQLKQQVSHERCINFAGQLKLIELPILYNVSTMMLTNDSGPGHFSSITDLKTYVIFGPETPALYGSLGNSTAIYAGLSCSPCVSASNHRKTPCSDNVCLQVIGVDQVMATISESL
ncbi:ADP-heptose--lipooligosaccharide heptosyltransferase II [hydrothermal vent metagenome]|uniref:ADP-heptose--lipooligosaccharide heptosyltransferase II n=1 Tax=hydrothermal vent metagenome TaxID=652676 RepID=A0A3B1AAR3_9ZZZZ